MKKQVLRGVGVALMLLGLVACGGSASVPVTLNDIPAFPGASELKPGESTIGDTLTQNNQTDAALRGQMGVGGKTEQKGFSLPADATWEQVKQFYNEKLRASGWGDSPASAAMEQANQANTLFRTANWLRGQQNVTVVMVSDPIDTSKKELIISLSSQ